MSTVDFISGSLMIGFVGGWSLLFPPPPPPPELFGGLSWGGPPSANACIYRADIPGNCSAVLIEDEILGRRAVNADPAHVGRKGRGELRVRYRICCIGERFKKPKYADSNLMIFGELMRRAGPALRDLNLDLEENK